MYNKEWEGKSGRERKRELHNLYLPWRGCRWVWSPAPSADGSRFAAYRRFRRCCWRTIWSSPAEEKHPLRKRFRPLRCERRHRFSFDRAGKLVYLCARNEEEEPQRLRIRKREREIKRESEMSAEVRNFWYFECILLFATAAATASKSIIALLGQT